MTVPRPGAEMAKDTGVRKEPQPTPESELP